MQAPPRRLVVAVVLGTILNPLNSSMIAVALVPLRRDFHVDLAQATWLVSAFYLAGAVAHPLMGRLADLFGARRVFLSGLALAGMASALAPLASSIGWLVGLRVMQASGTSATYPAGLALIRASTKANRVPAAALASISMAASVSAALGPTLGGFLLVTTNWAGHLSGQRSTDHHRPDPRILVAARGATGGLGAVARPGSGRRRPLHRRRACTARVSAFASVRPVVAAPLCDTSAVRPPDMA